MIKVSKAVNRWWQGLVLIGCLVLTLFFLIIPVKSGGPKSSEHAEWLEKKAKQRELDVAFEIYFDVTARVQRESFATLTFPKALQVDSSTESKKSFERAKNILADLPPGRYNRVFYSDDGRTSHFIVFQRRGSNAVNIASGEIRHL